MDDDLDLRNFSGLSRLFPLPRVVLLPHAVLPLHIFEPRYRQMTEDALNDDKLITIVQLSTAASIASPAPIEAVGCLGQILQHERLDDGRFNFLLLGRKRVRLTREISQEKLYRVAEVEILNDIDDKDSNLSGRSELTGLFRRVFEQQHKPDPDLEAILENPLPLGVLTDIVAHALGLPPEFKQDLLAEPRVRRRVNALLSILRQMAGPDTHLTDGWRPFPPPFSTN